VPRLAQKKRQLCAGVKNKGTKKGGNIGPLHSYVLKPENGLFRRNAQQIIPHATYAKMHRSIFFVFPLVTTMVRHFCSASLCIYAYFREYGKQIL